MPVSIDEQAEREARRACVRQLHGLGMSQAEVARALELPQNTVKYDLTVMKIPAHKERSAADRFARLFERFAVFSTISGFPVDQRQVVVDSHPGPYALVQLAIFLENVLDLPSTWTQLGVTEALFKKVMSAGTHEPKWCYALLETVFGPRQLVRDLYEVRREYLADVARGRASVPESTDAVYEALSARLVSAARESMRPNWPESERVEAMVRSALAQLDDRETDVIIRHYSFDEANDSIARGRGLSRERVRQILAQALRKLRHPSRRNTLDPLWNPIPLSWDATVGAQERLVAYRDGLTSLLESQAGLVVVSETLSRDQSTRVVDALCTNVDDLELSIRSANCLQNLNVKYAWELCTKTEADLLRVKHFGRKSLNEIKDVVATIPAGTTHLTLGMSREDPNIVAAMERCPHD